MKCIRVIEYEAETEGEIVRALMPALLTRCPVVEPGADVQGIGKINAGRLAPNVTIRLLSEEWEGSK